MSQIVIISEGNVVDVTDTCGSSARLFDGLLKAQDDLGQITWVTLTWNIALGLVGGHDPVAVFDLDTVNGMEVIHTTNWVNGNGDRPEIHI